MNDSPSTAEVAAATSVLRRLSPLSIEEPQFVELRAAAIALVKRACVKEAFENKDVKEFLAETTKHKETLKELRRLEALIRGQHRRERIDANECGLNSARKATLEQIKQECAALQHEQPRITDVSEPAGDDISASSMVRVRVRVRVEPRVQGAVTVTISFSVRRGGWSSDLLGRSLDEPFDGSVGGTSRLPPPGDFRRICNVCRGDCTHQARHDFYHQLCLRCAELNWSKRQQTADLRGHVALVTGGRVRIGYGAIGPLIASDCLGYGAVGPLFAR
jgi:hypothetical protein